MLRKGLLGMAAGAALLLLQVQSGSSQGVPVQNYNYSIMQVEQADKAPAPAEAMTAPSCCIPADCCNPCCERRGGLYGELGFMILKPYWRSNPAFYIEQDDAGPADGSIRILDFDYDSQFVPEITLGFVGGNGLGARIHWWGFADSTEVRVDNPNGDLDVTTPNILGAQISDTAGGDSSIATSRLRFDVWDFEATADIRKGCWDLQVAGGIRYAHLSQNFDAMEFDPVTGDVDDIVFSGHNFNGAGPTVAVDVRRRIGDSGLYLLAHGRGSFLFGETRQSSVDIDDGVNADEASNFYEQDSTLTALELRLGGGWQSCGSRRMQVFAEGAVVGQSWLDAGSSSRGLENIEDDGDVTADDAGPAPVDTPLSLFGFSLKAGIRY